MRHNEHLETEGADRGWRYLTLYSESPHDDAALDALERIIPEYYANANSPDDDRFHGDRAPRVRRIFPVIKNAGVPAELRLVSIPPFPHHPDSRSRARRSS
ncbi:MAG: hypothetical protein HYY60_01485 [Parcubacteria group bacterium]|nr:hypothetical protein [Parcubacteria group bacterium]